MQPTLLRLSLDLSIEPAIDHSLLAPEHDGSHANVESVEAGSGPLNNANDTLDGPLALDAEAAAEAQDAIAGSVVHEPVDLGFLNDSSKPLDENTAVDLLSTDEPSLDATTTFTGESHDPGNVVIDHSVVEPQAEDDFPATDEAGESADDHGTSNAI